MITLCGLGICLASRAAFRVAESSGHLEGDALSSPSFKKHGDDGASPSRPNPARSRKSRQPTASTLNRYAVRDRRYNAFETTPLLADLA